MPTPEQDAAFMAALNAYRPTPAQDAALLAAFKTYITSFLPAGTITPPTGTVTVTPPGSVTVTPPGTTSVTTTPPIPPPSGPYEDGATAAPAGVAQLPNLFTGYKTRPPWKVAGVDYRVGPRVATFKNAKTNTPPGCDPFYAGNATLNIKGPGVVTISGYDFTGIQVINASGSGITEVIVEDCLFNNPSVLLNFAWSLTPKLTCRYNWFKGSNNNEGVVNWTGNSSTYLYNYFDNCPGDGPNAKRSGTIDFRYNLMVNQATGSLGHLDQFTMAEGGDIAFKPCTFNFNTNVVNSVFAPGTGTQGFTLNGNAHYATWRTSGGSVSNNTWINTSTSTDNSAGVIFGIWLDWSTMVAGTTWTVRDNYVDDRGFRRMGYSNYVWLRAAGGPGPNHGKIVALGNIDLVDGSMPARFNFTQN